MSLAKWTVGLMAGMSMLAFAAQANAGEVRVTVAEYSAKTGPYFESGQEGIRGGEPRHHRQVRSGAVGRAAAEADHRHHRRHQCGSVDHRHALADRLRPAGRRRAARQLHDARLQGPLHRHLPVARRSWTARPTACRSPPRRARCTTTRSCSTKAGIAEPPATWTSCRTTRRKIKALGTGTFGFGLQGKEIETDVYYYYAMWSHGGEILNKDGKSALDTPGALEAAKLYKSMIDEGLTEPGVTSNNREDVQNLFKQGKVGMMITAPFLSNQIKDEAPNLQIRRRGRFRPGRPARAAPMASPIPSSCSRTQEQGRGLEVPRLPVHHRAARQVHARRRLPAGEQGRGQDGPLCRRQCRSAAFTALLPDARFRTDHPRLGRDRPDHSDAMQKIYLGRRRARGGAEGRRCQGQCSAEEIGLEIGRLRARRPDDRARRTRRRHGRVIERAAAHPPFHASGAPDMLRSADAKSLLALSPDLAQPVPGGCRHLLAGLGPDPDLDA